MKEKVAIIGSGPAGVYCSYLIPNAHLFERSGAVGMDASSFSIGDSRIDVPLRSFHPDYYPCLNQLYLHASIPTVVTNHSIGFSVNNVPYLTYQTVRILGYDIILPNQHLSPFLLSKIMADSVIFFYNCKYLQDERLLHTITCGIGEYMTSNGYCNELITNIIVPFVCTIATCSTEAGYSYPASYVLDFFARASHFESPRRGINA
jgi:predicted NAD/FAD-binding protein